MIPKSNLNAIALKYPKNADAPVIAAKGKGFVAEQILKIAEKNQIPVVKDEILANVLSVEEIGECIPENTWLAVAQIFAMILDMEKRN